MTIKVHHEQCRLIVDITRLVLRFKSTGSHHVRHNQPSVLFWIGSYFLLCVTYVVCLLSLFFTMNHITIILYKYHWKVKVFVVTINGNN